MPKHPWERGVSDYQRFKKILGRKYPEAQLHPDDEESIQTLFLQARPCILLDTVIEPEIPYKKVAGVLRRFGFQHKPLTSVKPGLHRYKQLFPLLQQDNPLVREILASAEPEVFMVYVPWKVNAIIHKNLDVDLFEHSIIGNMENLHADMVMDLISKVPPLVIPQQLGIILGYPKSNVDYHTKVMGSDDPQFVEEARQQFRANEEILTQQHGFSYIPFAPYIIDEETLAYLHFLNESLIQSRIKDVVEK